MARTATGGDRGARRGERSESLIQTIAAVLILSIFVLTAMVSFQGVLASARTHERLSFLDAALAQAKANIEAAPYAVPANHAAPAIPPVAFTLSVTQLTERLQQLTLTATNGPTRPGERRRADRQPRQRPDAVAR